MYSYNNLSVHMITSAVINDLINSLTIKEETKQKLTTYIMSVYGSPIDFVFEQLTNSFTRITDPYSGFSQRDINNIVSYLSTSNIDCYKEEIYKLDIIDSICGKYDLLDNCHIFYEDIFNNLSAVHKDIHCSHSTVVEDSELCDIADELYDIIPVLVWLIQMKVLGHLDSIANKQSYAENIVMKIEVRRDRLFIVLLY